MFTNDTSTKGLLSKIHKELMPLTPKAPNILIYKVGRGTE